MVNLSSQTPKNKPVDSLINFVIVCYVGISVSKRQVVKRKASQPGMLIPFLLWFCCILQ